MLSRSRNMIRSSSFTERAFGAKTVRARTSVAQNGEGKPVEVSTLDSIYIDVQEKDKEWLNRCLIVQIVAMYDADFVQEEKDKEWLNRCLIVQIVAMYDADFVQEEKDKEWLNRCLIVQIVAMYDADFVQEEKDKEWFFCCYPF
ncbi:hypothetical protein V6N13_037532 [Hibiscus sabdariffa]